MANYVVAGIQWRDTTRHTEWISIERNQIFAKCIFYFTQKHHLLGLQFVTKHSTLLVTSEPELSVHKPLI